MPYQHLTPIERGRLKALFDEGKNQSFIAKALGRHRSSICRELRRNNAYEKGYVPERAQNRYERVRKESVKQRQLDHLPLWNYLFERLSEKLSPEQVADRIELEYPDDPKMRISYETTYRALYSDERLRVLITQLRQARPKRRKRGMGKSRRGPTIPNRVSIEERPQHVANRLELGHWEGDTVIGKNQRGAIVTLVERKSLFLSACPVSSRNATEVGQAIVDTMNELPARGVKTITFDNGTEFAAHEKITAELGTPIYFAHTYSSNERARNENTNGLLRQYLPKGSSFEHLTRAQVEDIVNELNNRPRKTLGYRTPHEVFHNLGVALRV
jgi:transposase, IS30 family